ncbi:hypothetical protein BaRGS_00040192 [Batillaria attramentaria]|uniref:RING-type domain-containing protein n=1 Tax=Batillaria attramentaria TaxID=370345 RepID=A0ABD0J1N2_9CAEN
MAKKDVNTNTGSDGTEFNALSLRPQWTIPPDQESQTQNVTPSEETCPAQDVAIRPHPSHQETESSSTPCENDTPCTGGGVRSEHDKISHSAAKILFGISKPSLWKRNDILTVKFNRVFSAIYMLVAVFLTAMWLLPTWTFDSGGKLVSLAPDRQMEDSFLSHVLMRIFMLWVALYSLDFLPACKGKYRVRCRVSWPKQFVSNLLFSKGHVHERGRKGKHQRWKKVNHIGEHLDGFHFLSLRSSFLGAHLRLATVCPVNQQQPGENPPPPEDSGRQTQESRQPQDAASRQWPPESVNNIPWAAFCEEMRRLTTFADAPVTLPVFVIPLARAGFLRLPNGNIVCYFCGLTHNTWQAGDVPADVHRRLSPRCPMVTGINCNNQPVSSVPEEREKEVMQAWSLQGGIARQPGFVQEALDHPGQGQQPPQSSGGPPGAGLPRETASASNRGTDAASLSGPASLPVAQGSSSQAGGVTVGHHSLPSASLSSDAHTGDASAAQQAGQNVGAVAGAAAGVASNNVRDATVGPIIDGTAQPVVPPPSLGQETRDTTRSGSGRGQQVVTYEQLGISTEIPKRPDMAMINARVATYRNWPPANSHTPIQLAEAGFYYAGYADCGRCFFCGGGLKNWERNDNPWIEHARWFARCPYIRQCQGQDFIDIVQDLNATKQHSAFLTQISMDEVRAEINRRRAGGERLQEPIVDPAISGALEMGYTQEQIDRAVQQLHQEGYPLSADKLMDYLHVDGAAGGHDDADDDLDYEPGSVNQLVEENSEIRQQRMCKICLDKEVCIVFLPCGHLVCCAECSPAIRQCPMCRQRVKGRVRAFPG